MSTEVHGHGHGHGASAAEPTHVMLVAAAPHASGAKASVGMEHTTAGLPEGDAADARVTIAGRRGPSASCRVGAALDNEDRAGRVDMTKRQTILVAGATGSIGYSAAVALARDGARVVLLGRRAEKLSSRADSIRDALTDAGVEHEVTDIAALVIDFSGMESVRSAAEEALNRFPRSRWPGVVSWRSHPGRARRPAERA